MGKWLRTGRKESSSALPDGEWAHRAVVARVLLRDWALIAIAYVLAGRLGQLLAVPPTYATAVWPASGIALAGLLLLGYRVWPGLFLGATVVNAWSLALHGNRETALLLGASIAVGATAQAVLGTFLIRRFIGYPNALNHDRDIWGFLMLGGPVACIVGALWGVVSLYFVGTLDAAQIGLNWWTWWIGDVLGVVIFAPLSLIFFSRPRPAWRPRLVSVALPISAAFIATILGFIYTRSSEKVDACNTFSNRASRVVSQIREHVDDNLDMIHSVEGVYASTPIVERRQFETLNRHLRGRHPAVQAVKWLPRVSHAERAEYQSRARSEGLPEYVFSELGCESKPAPAAARGDYFSVFFAAPRLTHEMAARFDSTSIIASRHALTQSCDTGQQVATGPLTATRDATNQRSVLVFEPVYSRELDVASIAERRRALRGFVLGIFQVHDIVNFALRDGCETGFSFRISDVSDPNKEQLLYLGQKGESSAQVSDVSPVLVKSTSWSETFPVAGRTWRCDFTPTAAFFAERENRDSWLILVSGLSFTSMLGAFLLVLTGRTARIEDLVLSRTQALAATNQELAREIVIRQRIEQDLSQSREHLERRVQARTAELKRSESRYLDLYNNAPDMFVTMDVATQLVIECNERLLSVTGYTKTDIIGQSIYNLYHPDCLDEARRAFHRFLATGQMKDFELLLLCVDGDVIDASMNVSAVRDESGKLLYSRAVLRDITAKKRAESQIKQQEVELAHVSRLSLMGEMAAGLAHELNQPLAAIAAYAEGAALRLRGGNIDATRLATVVDRIAADAHRAGAVIRRLRRFVRKREPDRAEVDMNRAVLDVVQFIDADFEHRKVSIELELSDALPPVRGDVIEIQQVLLNLVRNGCDAMADTDPARRKLLIRTSCTESETVEVDVVDQGHGLSASMDEQVFEAFFTSKEKGLGLGLAISRSIIESHGGRIWVTPNFEEGATFSFSLPAFVEVLIDD